MPHINIIIVTWNGLHHLKNYLPSVVENSGDIAEIIIADNHSDDGTEIWLKHTYPQVRHVYLDDNYGYCGGNNRAAEHAKGEFLLFLNNDVEVSEGWLEPILGEFQKDEKVAAVQPKIKSVMEPEFFEYAGAAGGMMDKFGYPFCRGRLFDSLEKDTGQYNQATDIVWASGAALAIRKSLFHKIGRFDERFQFHMEEIDLCWRLLNQGYKIRYCPHSEVFHLGGGSLQTGSPRKTFYNYRNSLFMLMKNLPKGKAFRRIFFRMCLDAISSFRTLSQGNWRDTLAIIKAHLSFYLRLSDMFKSRRILLKSRTIKTDPEEISRFLIIWRYFIKGQKTYGDVMG